MTCSCSAGNGTVTRFTIDNLTQIRPSQYTRNVDIGSLRDLQNAVSQYTNPADLAVAGGPLAASMVARVFVAKNKMLKIATVGSGIWFAVKEVSGPAMGVITDNFGYLQQIFGHAR
jgi:hypothetical protein